MRCPKDHFLISLALVCAFLTGCSENRAPIQPSSLLGPTLGLVDSVYSFTAVTADLDGDSVCYRFAWGDGDTSSWTAWVGSGESGTVTHSWDSVGMYLVTAQAKDVRGLLSPWTWQDGTLQVLIVPVPLKWCYQTGGPVFASPAISSDGTVYVGSNDQPRRHAQMALSGR